MLRIEIIKGDNNYSHQQKLNLLTNLLTFYTPFDNKKIIQYINKLCYLHLFKVQTFTGF